MKHIVLTVSPDCPAPSVEQNGLVAQDVPTGAVPAPPPAVDSPAATVSMVSIETHLPEHEVELVKALVLGLAASGGRDVSESLIATLMSNGFSANAWFGGEHIKEIVKRVEKVVIQYAFEKCDRVESRTAEWLVINRETLHKKRVRYKQCSDTVDGDDSHSDRT